MGWSSGSRIFSEIIEVIVSNVDESDIRASIYDELIDIFEYNDADTLDECLGIDSVFDNVWLERNPEEIIDKDDTEDWDDGDRSEF